MEAYEALVSRKKSLAVAAVALGLLGAQGAGVAYGQEETTGGGTTTAPTPAPGPGGGDTVITEDDDRVGAGDVLVIEGGYVVGPGASLILKDADGTTGSFVDGKNAAFEKGEGETLRLRVTKEPTGLKGGDKALSTEGLVVESSKKIQQEETPPPTVEETPPPPGGTTGFETTGGPAPETTGGPAPETTAEEPPGGATDANQPEVLGPQETTAPDEGTVPEEPGGETPNGRPVEIGEESTVDAGDVLLVEGAYDVVAEGASAVLTDDDGTTGTLVDGENAEFTPAESVLELAVTGNVLELSGGDGELTLEGLAVKESEGITAPNGGGTTTGTTEPETEEPRAEEPRAEEPRAEGPDEIPVGDPNRTATPETPDETTALPEETTAMQPEGTVLPEDTTAMQPEGTGEPLPVPDEGTVPNEECAGAAEIETFSGSEGMSTAPFETAGGSFQVVYEVAREGAAEDDLGQGGTTADGGSEVSGEFGLTVRALEHETGERVAEETAEAATGEMMVEMGPGLYALEIAPVNSDYAVTVMDCQEEDSPEEDPREGTTEEPTPEEITERYGDPGRIVEEERKETPPAPSPDGGTLLPVRLPDTGGAAAVVLPVLSVLLGTGMLAGAIIRRRRDR